MAWLSCAVMAGGQASAHPAKPPTAVAGRRPPGRPAGDLAQVMRGILFPNSNLLFDVQQNDPGAPPKLDTHVNGSASKNYADVYTGWQVVEGAATAIAESADIILKRGRLCSNGRP